MVVALIIKTQSKFLHLVFVALNVVASDAKIIILQKKRRKVAAFYPKNSTLLETSLGTQSIIHPAISYLTNSAMKACLNMVFAFIACVDKAVLSLIVQFY